MAIIKPKATVTLDDPRAERGLNKHGMAVEYQFDDIKEWTWSNTEYLPEINAACLRGQLWKAGMIGWTTSGSWVTVTPPGYPAVTYMKFQAKKAGNSGYAQVGMPANPSVVLRWIAAEPSIEAASQPLVALTFLAGNVHQFRLTIPYVDGQSASYPFPVWEWTQDGGTSWEVLSYVERGPAAIGTGYQQEGEKMAVVRIFLPYVLINFSGMNDTWVYENPHLWIPTGFLRFSVQAHSVAFNCQQIRFPSSGYVQSRKWTALPSWVGTTKTLSARSEEPYGTATSATVPIGTGTQYQVRATLTAYGWNASPLVYMIEERHDPTFISATSSSSDISSKVARISGRETSVRRGATCTIELNLGETVSGLSLNDWLRVQAGWEGSGVPATHALFTGFVRQVRNARTGGGRDVGRVRIEVDCQDKLVRLEKKYAWQLPDFRGWKFTDAFKHVLNRAGVHDNYISVPSDDWHFHVGWPGALQIKFAKDMGVPQVLDELCNMRGFVWGINESGTVYCKEFPIYSGTPDFTLDEASAAETETLLWVTGQKDLDRFANMVVDVGTDEYGDEVYGQWFDEASVTTPGAANFVGDDLWDVRNDPNNRYPLMTAAYRAWLLDDFDQALEWRTEGKDLHVDDFVVVNPVANIGVTAGTVFRIIAKEWELRTDPWAYDCKFTGIVVR